MHQTVQHDRQHCRHSLTVPPEHTTQACACTSRCMYKHVKARACTHRCMYQSTTLLSAGLLQRPQKPSRGTGWLFRGAYTSRAHVDVTQIYKISSASDAETANTSSSPAAAVQHGRHSQTSQQTEGARRMLTHNSSNHHTPAPMQ